MANITSIPITVHDLAGVSGPRPVSGGVPLAPGAAPAGTAFTLSDASGRAVDVQTRVLATWQDGSARWLLLDFRADVQAGTATGFQLAADRPAAAPSAAAPSDAAPSDAAPGNGAPSSAAPSSAAPTAAAAPGAADRGDRIDLGTMWLQAPAAGGLLDMAGHLAVDLILVDGDGVECQAVTESAQVECAGPVRATLVLRGAFHRPGSARRFQFRLRASIYAGFRRARLEPLILVDADSGIIQRIRSLELVLRPTAAGATAVRLGGDPGWHGATGPHHAPVRLFQRDDQRYEIQGMPARGGKAPGWAEIRTEAETIAVALRDFWQQWPKSLEARPDGLALGLFPRFVAGDFAHMEPWYKHQYLFDGDCYQLRTGQARRWEVWVDLEGDGQALTRLADALTVPAADPSHAVGTGVWGAVVPAGAAAMEAYDPWAEGLFHAYCDSIRTQRDYGAMNWGDWFGERQVNWGNHEYDTVDQLLIQYARTGDPRYFLVADAAARHSTEVDVIHHVNADLAAHFTSNWPGSGYPPRPGMVHEHCVGHVGSFYSVETVRQLFVEHKVGDSPRPYLCLDPFNLGHIWTQGMVHHYFLTGDPFIRETAACIGDNLARLVEDRTYTFGIDDPHFGRAAGWPLLAMAGAYELELEQRFLAAMRDLVDRALDRQDPVCGGWLYELYPGHCLCTTRKHVGAAGFITAILINALSSYHLLTGDDRIPAAVDRAVTFLDNDTWIDHQSQWRYTSCPASAPSGQPGVTVAAHVHGVRLSSNPEHLRVLRRAWEAKFAALRQAPASAGRGKTYTATMYGCAEAAGLLAQAR